MVALMGASGSGKSTLLNILGGLDSPDEGQYRLAGVNVTDLPRATWAKIRGQYLGFIFQSFNLIAGLSAVENVELPLIYQGVSRRDRRQRSLALLSQMHMTEHIHHRPSQLSGGQQQRVAIARALVTNPSVLLADEPTGNLDSQSSRDVLNILELLHRAGHTLLIVTHDSQVAELCQRTWRVQDGHVSCDRKESLS